MVGVARESYKNKRDKKEAVNEMRKRVGTDDTIYKARWTRILDMA